jgi:hypothetical protein
MLDWHNFEARHPHCDLNILVVKVSMNQVYTERNEVVDRIKHKSSLCTTYKVVHRLDLYLCCLLVYL